LARRNYYNLKKTIKISKKSQGKTLYHVNKRIHFDRISGGIGWPSERPESVVILGEVGEVIVNAKKNVAKGLSGRDKPKSCLYRNGESIS